MKALLNWCEVIVVVGAVSFALGAIHVGIGKIAERVTRK
jgi:hypothetical protein